MEIKININQSTKKEMELMSKIQNVIDEHFNIDSNISVKFKKEESEWIIQDN